MKKILIVANLFHASPRIPNVARNLPSFGYEPWIVTPPVDAQSEQRLGLPGDFRAHVRLVEVPYRGDVLWLWRRLFRLLSANKTGSVTEEIKKTLGAGERTSLVDKSLHAYQSIFGYPDTEKYWITPVLRRIASVVTRADFQAVLSSSPYPTSHLIARQLKERYHLPWLADFRDPWAENHNYGYGKIRRALDRRLEKRTLASADAITAASPSYAAKEERLHQRKVMVITNGFDPVPANDTIPLTDKFTITYAGSIYRHKQNPDLFLKSLRELLDEKRLDADKTEVRFYGERLGWVHDLIVKYRLTGIVREYGRVSRQESLVRQRESQVLLILGWEGKDETGVFPLKTFEYLGARRPIVISGGAPDEEIKKIIRDAGAGDAGMDETGLKNIVARHFRSYKESGSVPHRVREEVIRRYSWPAIAGQFADIFSEMTDGSKAQPRDMAALPSGPSSGACATETPRNSDER
jgi:glycosyltransferase involved in cell wall biosynthesis